MDEEKLLEVIKKEAVDFIGMNEYTAIRFAQRIINKLKQEEKVNE